MIDMFKGKRQTLEQFQAFEFYYSLGSNRRLSDVEKKFGKGRSTVHDWSRVLNWQDRIKARDELICERLENIFTDFHVAERAALRQEIKVIRMKIAQIVENSRAKIESGEIKIECVRDAVSLLAAGERLIRCGLLVKKKCQAVVPECLVLKG